MMITVRAALLGSSLSPACFVPLLGAAQSTEYVSNGDFESGATPACWGQGHFASNWETQNLPTTNSIYHSPDLFDDNVTFPDAGCTPPVGLAGGYARLAMGAASGNRYMGIGAYEIVEQEFGHVLNEDYHYTVSMDVVLSDQWPSEWSGTFAIRIGLAKSEVKYASNNTNGNDICTNDFVNYQDGPSQDIRILSEQILLLSDYPPSEGWRRISASFRGWDNVNSYDWLFIDVVRFGYEGSSGFSDECFGDYVYVDNVSLKRAEYCASACAPDLGPLVYGDYFGGMFVPWMLQDAMEVQDYNYFSVFVRNAIGIDFKVISGWGGLIYEQYAFDPNGLIDPGFPDYMFAWYGEDYQGNPLSPQTEDFVFNLRMWNCNPGDVIQLYGQSLIYIPGGTHDWQVSDIVNYELDDCCEDHRYYQNVTFTGFNRTDVQDFITAGSNVTSSPPGPVVVSGSSHVVFHAGNEINLEPGFTVQQGGLFNAVISNCIYGETRATELPRRLAYPDVTGRGEQWVIWPNPSSEGKLSVVMPKQGNMIVIYDVLGRVVYSGAAVSGIQVIEVNDLSPGTYLVHAIGGDGAVLCSEQWVRL